MRRQNVPKTMRKQTHVIGSALIYLGSCLLALVGGAYVYGRLESWTQSQPRALVSTRILWPQVPPLTPLPSPTPLPLPTPTPTPTPGPPVRVEIPTLGINRSIVQVGIVTRGEELEWDVEQLYATSSRSDLVGHVEGSANPGQTGNIILVGHNYNRGFYNWEGVFYSLHLLAQGDVITLFNENDEFFIYQVDQVDQVPWQTYDAADTMMHIVYLSPKQEETLTLVTCGRANLTLFPSRVYVVAKRLFAQE